MEALCDLHRREEDLRDWYQNTCGTQPYIGRQLDRHTYKIKGQGNGGVVSLAVHKRRLNGAGRGSIVDL